LKFRLNSIDYLDNLLSADDRIKRRFGPILISSRGLMRIVAFSDIHGAHKTVLTVLRRESTVDVVVLAGDLTTRGSPSEAGSALEAVKDFGKPVVAVAGNMDPPGLEETFERLGVSVNNQGTTIGDAGFFGVSASPFSPLRTPYEISEDEILRRAEAGWQAVAGARWKIFVPHSPPRNTALDRIWSGKHVGSEAIRGFVERRAPDLLICGHIHESRGTDTLGKTRMVNCGEAGKGYYAVVTLGEVVEVECRVMKGV
jgi:Icc-related predicted phosphoesterase